MPENLVTFLLHKLFWGVLRHFLSDRQYIRFRYRLEFGRLPDLENPQTFTEKIQYIKLHRRSALRRLAANRIAVRQYVAEKIGPEHLIPLAGLFDRLTPEAWASLPRRFVLKANHGCGMVKIVTDKQQEDFGEIRDLAASWQRTDYYRFSREWVYKGLPRQILAEELLLTDEGTVPQDYKFFCFHGRAEVIQIDFGRFSRQTRNLYDRDFNLLPANILYKNHPEEVKKPPLLDEAVRIAETLAAEFDFIRVDLYLVDNRVCFGELTNYPGNGFAGFKPESFDKELGGKWRL